MKSAGWCPYDEINDLIRRNQRALSLCHLLSLPLPSSLPPFLPSFTLSPMWGYSSKATICKPGPNHASTWSLTFPPPELWENNVCFLSHPVCGILLWQPEQTRTPYLVYNLLGLCVCTWRCITYKTLIHTIHGYIWLNYG